MDVFEEVRRWNASDWLKVAAGAIAVVQQYSTIRDLCELVRIVRTTYEMANFKVGHIACRHVGSEYLGRIPIASRRMRDVLMPSSPNKPRRSRHSAHNSADLAIRTLSSRSRTSSQGSISQSATSPGRTTDDAFGALIASQNQAEEAHGNLADELADILDEEDEADINLEKAPGVSSSTICRSQSE